MACRDLLKSLMCCCVDRNSTKLLKKKAKEHKFCGCKESSKQRGKMQTLQTCDVDRRSLVDTEVVEALDYEFQVEDLDTEDVLIEDPLIPFNHVLRKPLHPQSDITVQGVLDKKALRFAVNLVTVNDPIDDIVFHFNPRLDQQYSARNSFLNGKWGHEEGNSQTKFPFQRGKSFLIEIFLTHSEFLVAVNGAHYCSYTYRTSLLNITGLQVIGGVSIHKVHVTDCYQYPSAVPRGFPPCPYTFTLNASGLTVNKTQMTPVYGVLRGKLKKKSKIVINGRVKLLPVSFYVNLQEGSQVWPHPVIPLHVSVRFNQDGRDHQVMLANAWVDQWGAELFSDTEFLFTPGLPFKMIIQCQEDAFIVTMDEKILFTFKHRVPYGIVDTIHIQGDVFIFDISITM